LSTEKKDDNNLQPAYPLTKIKRRNENEKDNSTYVGNQNKH
jgi:hypothetical protein